MHTVLYRLNTLATLVLTCLSVIASFASLTDFFHESNPEVSMEIVKFERFGRFQRRPYRGNDEIVLALNVSADLTSVFTWNTKQLFVFICAEYKSDKNELNHVSLWDRIIQQREQAKFSLPFNRNKYFFIDQGNHLRGKEINLTMYWNVMPIAGALRVEKKTISGFKLPYAYMS